MASITHNLSIIPEVRPVVAELNRFATRPDVLAALRQGKTEGEKKLLRDPSLATAFVAFDLAQYGWANPEKVGSARVFVSRDSGEHDRFERHANSTQYLFALGGPVQTYVQTKDGLRVDSYGEGDATVLENRWQVVPPGIWHKSVVPGARNWWVVAFHTARNVTDEYQ
jgi:hypothetical protein